MSALTRYPRYTTRSKLKASFNSLSPAYLASLRKRLAEKWSDQRELISQELGTGELSEFRHWLQALVEATYDIETGMVPCETKLPGLTELIHDYGPSARPLYTALFILSCWELGLSSRSSEGALAHEAKMAGLSTRALLEILRRAEPAREALDNAERPPPTPESRAEDDERVYSIVVSPINADRAGENPKTELAAALRDRFRQAEREVLLQRMAINPEDVKLNPLTRDDFVWAVVAYSEQRQRLRELWDAVERERPGSLFRPNPF
jgi:hypothetical protein